MKKSLKYFGVILATLSVSLNSYAAVTPSKTPVKPPPSPQTNVPGKSEIKAQRNLSIMFGASYKGVAINQIQCLGSNRGADSVVTNSSAELKSTSVNCTSAIIDGQSAKNVKLTFFEDKTNSAKPSSFGSYDCVTIFKNWQNNPKLSAFIANWDNGRLACKNTESAIPTYISGLQFKPKNTFAILSAFSNQGLLNPRALYETKIDGVSNHWTGTTIWAKRGIDLNEAQRFVFFSDGPRKEAKAFIQIFKATKLSNGVLVAPKIANDCANWKNTQGSIFTFPIDVSVAKTNNENKIDFGQEIKGIFDPYWISGNIQKPLFMAIQAKSGGDQTVYARFVLVQPGTENCAERPTSLLKIDYGIDPMSQFNNDVKDSNTKAAEFDKQAKAKYDAAKAAANAKPGVQVAIASYIPRHYDSATMQAIPAYFPSALKIDGRELGTWVPNWKLAEDIPWPKGKRDWKEGCYFNTGSIQQAILLGKSWKPSGIWEGLITGLSMFATAWSAMKDVFVSAFVSFSTFGACPANFPGQPQEKMPKACSYLKTATKAGLNIAMTTVGIPPEIPSAKSLIEGGAEYLATQAVDYGLKQVAGSGASEYLSTATEYVGQQAIDELTDYARKKMVSEIKSQLVNMTEAGSCPFPAASAQEAKEKGYTAWNPNNQCGSKTTDMGSNLASLGKVAPSAAGDEDNAVLWLNLKPVPEAQGRGKTVTVTVSTPDFTFPSGYPEMLKKEILKYGTNGQLRLFRPVTFSIDSANVGAEGMKVPVNLTLNNDDWNVWKQMVQKANVCALNAFYESCIEESAIGNRNWLLTQPQTLSIDVSYRWTNDESILKQCANFKDFIGGKIHCATFDPTEKFQTMKVKQVLSKTWGGNYGIPNYSNVCPGYKVATAPETGLPFVTHDWGPDDLK